MYTLVHIHAIIAQEQMPVLIAVLPAVDPFLHLGDSNTYLLIFWSCSKVYVTVYSFSCLKSVSADCPVLLLLHTERYLYCRNAAAASTSYAQATDVTRAGQTKLRFYLAGKLVPASYTIFQVCCCFVIKARMNSSSLPAPHSMQQELTAKQQHSQFCTIGTVALWVTNLCTGTFPGIKLCSDGYCTCVCS